MYSGLNFEPREREGWLIIFLISSKGFLSIKGWGFFFFFFSKSCFLGGRKEFFSKLGWVE